MTFMAYVCYQKAEQEFKISGTTLRVYHGGTVAIPREKAGVKRWFDERCRQLHLMNTYLKSWINKLESNKKIRRTKLIPL